MQLNLDDDLKQFDIFNIANELLQSYYNEHENNKIDYYEDKLKSKYPIIYKIYSLFDFNSYDSPYKYTYEELYYIAENTYSMKGSLDSVKYICSCLNINISGIDPTTGELNYISIDNYQLTAKYTLGNELHGITRVNSIQVYLDMLFNDLLFFGTLSSVLNKAVIDFEMSGSIRQLWSSEVFTYMPSNALNYLNDNYTETGSSINYIGNNTTVIDI